MTTTLQELDEILALFSSARDRSIHNPLRYKQFNTAETLAANFMGAHATEIRAALELQQGWQPIETAPKDGTTIDVWRDEQRETVYWGLPPHECGEMGQHCDSDWHRIKNPGWICSMFGEFMGGAHNPFTHWMSLPSPPAQGEQE